MLLKLLTKRKEWHCVAEQEVSDFYDEKLDWKGNIEMREKLTNLMAAKMKNDYQKMLENAEWEIILVAESKVHEEIQRLEEAEKFKVKQILKIA